MKKTILLLAIIALLASCTKQELIKPKLKFTPAYDRPLPVKIK